MVGYVPAILTCTFVSTRVTHDPAKLTVQPAGCAAPLPEQVNHVS
jgi:hypothetical protein